VKQLRERIEEHHRRTSASSDFGELSRAVEPSPRPNLRLLKVWQDSLAHWQKAEAEARRRLALC
jgi:hypothetical protein